MVLAGAATSKPTGHMPVYETFRLDGANYQNPDYKFLIDAEKSLDGFVNMLQRNSAQIAQRDRQPLVLASEFLSGVSLAEQAIKKAILDPKWQQTPVKNPVKNWSITDWFSDQIYIGHMVPDGKGGTMLSEDLIKFTKVYENGKVVNVLSTTVKANKVLLPLDASASEAAKRIQQSLEQVKSAGYKYLEVASVGNVLGAAVTMADIEQLLPIAKQYWLNAGALSSVLNSVQVNIENLSSNIAAQTQDNRITFDTDGAGWGWFVDNTPSDFEEFTQLGEDEWLARSDSLAHGKLDLLAVMIHELGHTLGLEHSHEGTMEGLLQLGERHLPGAEEIAFMSGLRKAVTASPRVSASRMFDGPGRGFVQNN